MDTNHRRLHCRRIPKTDKHADFDWSPLTVRPATGVAGMTELDHLKIVPPQNLEAESCVLGAVLLENDSILAIRHHIEAADFYRESNAKIFTAMTELLERHEPMDLITLSEFLKGKNELEAVGGSSYLAVLADYVPTTANVEFYARIIREKSFLRKLLAITRQMQESIYSEQEDPATIAAQAISAFTQLESSRPGGFVHVGAVMIETIKRIEAAHEKGSTISGIPTGFHDLDSRLGGIHPGELWVAAGRPGMGKTAFALDIAEGAAQRNFGVCFVSLAMENPRVGQRLLSSATNIENRNLRRGLLLDRDFPIITAESAKLSELPLWLLDSDRQWDRIKSKIRSLKLREPELSLVVIDYVGLISAPVRNGERYLEVGRVSAEAKRLALDLQVGVVLLSQLNREVESRADKRPQLADLRESGSLEQDADVVCFLYRDVYYNRETNLRELAELNVAKNREGVTGMLKLRFDEQTVSFTDWTEQASADVRMRAVGE
jgi:replicative DNA helicase